jgi:hypothetical protein
LVVLNLVTAIVTVKLQPAGGQLRMAHVENDTLSGDGAGKDKSRRDNKSRETFVSSEKSKVLLRRVTVL